MMTVKPLERGSAAFTEEPNWLVRSVQKVEPQWWPYLLRLSDSLLIVLAFIVAYWVRYRLQWFRGVDPVFQADFSKYTFSCISLVAILFLLFQFSGVYRQRRGRMWLEEIYTIAGATTIGIVILITVNLLFRPLLYSRLLFLYTAILIVIFIGLSRAGIALMRRYLRRYGIGVERVVLVGAGDVGRMVMRTIAARPGLGYQLIGFLDDNPSKGSTDIGRIKALGPIENFTQILDNQAIDLAIICLPWQSQRTVARLVNECEQAAIKVQVVPDLFQSTKNQMHVEELDGIPLISTRTLSIAGWNFFFKRLFDIVFSGFIAIVALPLGLLIALLIRLDSPGPVIYAQTRVGKNGQQFKFYKFRSMVIDADERREQIACLNESSGPLFKMKDDPRCTRIGSFLRRFSLDELPQLFNVLRGEMSLIGPRPNLPQEVDQYQEWHKKRLSVSPGMTGLWQVSGRSDLTFDEMVLLDIYYAENWSFGLDMSILLTTIPKVLLGKGAY
jgi:exopolysaccharide biosynthesis polyprenyl glycosylphosphotransferase